MRLSVERVDARPPRAGKRAQGRALSIEAGHAHDARVRVERSTDHRTEVILTNGELGAAAVWRFGAARTGNTLSW